MIRLVETIGWRVSQCLILWWIALGLAWLTDATTLTAAELFHLAMLGIAAMVGIMFSCAAGAAVWVLLKAMRRSWHGQRAADAADESIKSTHD
jgi:hypothetical protein